MRKISKEIQFGPSPIHAFTPAGHFREFSFLRKTTDSCRRIYNMHYISDWGELLFSLLPALEEEECYQHPSRLLPAFTPGDVLEVPFPFTDLSGFKTRPVLVLARSKMDITVAYISTHITWAGFEDMILLPCEKNGLHSISLFRTGKLFSIDPRLVSRKIGEVEEADLQAAMWCLKGYFSGNVWPQNPGSSFIKDLL